MDHSDFLPLIEQYIRPALGPKVANQFIQAIDKPLDNFSERFVWRHLSHICVSDTVRETGRTHQLAHEIRDLGKADWPHHRNQLTYWTNTMVMAEKYVGADGKERWVEPSRRVVGGFPYCFTLEWDIKDIEFLKTQMSWCRSSGKPIDAPLGGLYRELSQYADFMGITACWSGNKSLHIHVMFDSYPVMDKLKLDRRAMRDGFAAHWDRLVEITMSVLGIPYDLQPDAILRLPEAFRRIPWGTRVIGKGQKVPQPNILGMPIDTVVPQVTLWEMYRKQRGAEADELFFQAGEFLRREERERARKLGVGSGDTPIRPGPLDEEVRVYCETRLRQHCERKWGAWPKLYRLEWVGGHWVASFYNSKDDSRASSIIRDDYSHLMMCGRDAWKGKSPPPLDFKLGVLLALWLKERKTNTVAVRVPDEALDPDDLVTWVDSIRNRELTPLETAFQAGATDKDEVQDLTRRAVLEAVGDNPLTYMRGPEGAGKTRGLIAVFDELVKHVGGQEKIHMMASGNYDAAAEKAREFNAAQNRNGYHAVVVASWEREYRDVCRKAKVRPLIIDDALVDGYSSLWSYVCDKQPKILKDLERRHHEVWSEIGSRRPVFMSSHAMMQNWTKYSHTRCFWHREFWPAHKLKDQDWMAALRTDMQLGIAVHDEVSAGDFLEIHRVEAVDWVQDLKREYAAWRKTGGTLEKWETYGEFLGQRGKPQHRGKSMEFDFQTCQRIADGSDKSWREVVVQDSGEYGRGDASVSVSRHRSEDIYAQAVGNRWMVRPKNWWAGLARRIVVLTTELIPTIVASNLPPVKVLGSDRNDRQAFRIVELECPMIERDSVRVTFDRACTAANVNEVIARFRQEQGEDFLVISDRATESDRTMSHARAKGSNGLMGRDLMQTMLHMGPEEKEMYEVLNGWVGVRTCVRLRHVDCFNQSAGRNLGFRKRGVDPHHWLVLSASLWGKIDTVLVENSRYDFRLWLSQNEQREIRRRQPELNETTRSGGETAIPAGDPIPQLDRDKVCDLISVLLSKTSNTNILNKEAV